MSETTTDIDPQLDEEWLAAPRARSRLSAVLLAALLLSVAFLGGVLVQKHWGAGGAGDAASSPFGLAGGLPSGAAPSGFPGLAGAAPGGSAEGSASPGGGQSGTGGSTGTTSVIGTVVSISGTEWVVEDLGGKRHTVTVPKDTTVVREERSSTDTVAKGDTVTVAGTAAGDSLNASRITLR